MVYSALVFIAIDATDMSVYVFITHHSKHDVIHECCWEQEQQNGKCQGSHKELVW
jgi:hypothetical protein